MKTRLLSHQTSFLSPLRAPKKKCVIPFDGLVMGGGELLTALNTFFHGFSQCRGLDCWISVVLTSGLLSSGIHRLSTCELGFGAAEFDMGTELDDDALLAVRQKQQTATLAYINKHS
jgi:hypothetical protein